MNFKKHTVVCTFFAAIISIMASCVADEKIEVTPQCAIVSFGVRDIVTVLHTTTSDGTADSTYTRTIGGNYIKFNIDQVNGFIESTDSLPTWVDMKHIVPTVTFSGTLFVEREVNGEKGYYMFASDSLDFSDTIRMLVVASDKVSAKRYKVVIHQSTADADSLLWTKVAANVDASDDARLLTFGGQMCLFNTTLVGQTVAMSDNGTEWSTPANLNPLGALLDLKSMTAFGNRLVAVDASGDLYSSEDALNWTLASETRVERLLSADANYVYALVDGNIVASSDLQVWRKNGAGSIEKLPGRNLATLSYPSRTNKKLNVAIMAGTSDGVSGHSAVWYKISAPDVVNDQAWDYIAVTEENSYALPLLDNLQLLHYGDAVLAFGGDNSRLYRSEDNGITWHPIWKKQLMPKDIESGKAAQAVVFDKHIWIVQRATDGSTAVWKGIINNMR